MNKVFINFGLESDLSWLTNFGSMGYKFRKTEIQT